MDLKDKIKELRPHLSSSSIRAYNSSLRSLANKLNIKEPLTATNIEKNEKEIKTYLSENKPARVRKSIYSALVTMLAEKPESKTLREFKEIIMKDGEDYEREIRSQKLSKTQEENYIDWNTIIKIYNNLKTEANTIMKKENITKSDKRRYQQFLILSLYVLLKPRRLMDYTLLKYKDYSPNEDNFVDLKKNIIVFNQYKSAKFYGKQEVKLEPALKKIINNWIKIKDNDSDFLLQDTRGNSLNPVKLNSELYVIFDPLKVSANLLRHSYLTNVLGNIDLEKLDEQAEQMGHSVTQALEYVKKVDKNIIEKNDQKVLKKSKK
jgi:integrase